MGNYDFNEDLENESKTINEIVDKLKNSGIEVLKLGHTNHGDIKVRLPKTGEVAWIEVKEDFGKYKGNWTYNVAVEWFSRNKPSGISNDGSKYWIYKIHSENGIQYYWFERIEILQLMYDGKYKKTRNGGDKGSNTMMHLYSLPVFTSAGREIWNE